MISKRKTKIPLPQKFQTSNIRPFIVVSVAVHGCENHGFSQLFTYEYWHFRKYVCNKKNYIFSLNFISNTYEDRYPYANVFNTAINWFNYSLYLIDDEGDSENVLQTLP